MSIWEFTAAVGGWVKANATEEGLTSEEAEALAASLDRPPVWH